MEYFPLTFTAPLLYNHPSSSLTVSSLTPTHFTTFHPLLSSSSLPSHPHTSHPFTPYFPPPPSPHTHTLHNLSSPTFPPPFPHTHTLHTLSPPTFPSSLPPQIPESFADCLGGLLSVVGQNLSLKLEAQGENTITAVHANRTVNWTTANKT